METINYLKEYLHSKVHAIFGGCTLGVGLMSGSWLMLIVGVVAYVLGVMFIPDLPWFRKKIDSKYQAVNDAAESARIEEFRFKRDKQLSSLTKSRREKYNELSNICREIERSTMESITTEDAASDVRLRKLDELMFTYLKLLCIEQSVEIFLESERDENIPKEIEQTQNNIKALVVEIEKLKENPNATRTLDAKQRLFNSFSEKLDVLNKRMDRYEQAKSNIQLVSAEQQRLCEQIKLLRADVVATRNADAISSRIDASISHLEDTNKWLSEMNEFKDVVGDIPSSSKRIGFDESSEKDIQSNMFPEELYNRPKIRTTKKGVEYSSKTA